jgi:hypothetical protein
MTRRCLVFALISSTFVAGCPAPGKGAKAERGFRRAAPVIAALQAYHRDSANYPRYLIQLVPGYLADSALSKPKRSDEYSLEYNLDSSGYRLRFRYAGPGMNRCEYASRADEWRCSGLF